MVSKNCEMGSKGMGKDKQAIILEIANVKNE